MPAADATTTIKLYTSIPPKARRSLAGAEVGPAYIAECVKSWKRNDFDVISLNSNEEIEALATLGYEVEFRGVPGGRPTIGAFLQAILQSKSPIAGIINADTFLANDPDLMRVIAQQSASGMTMIERINIDPMRLRPTGRSCHGFDAFIFSTDLISEIDPNPEFLFGQPWWDYWFPLVFASKGGRLMTPADPVLFHLDHAQSWNHQQWLENAKKTVGYLDRSSGRLPLDFATKVQALTSSKDLSERQLGPFSFWCFDRIRSMADVLSPAGGTDFEAFRSMLSLMDDAYGRRLLGELNEARAWIVGLRDQSRIDLVTANEIDAGAASAPDGGAIEPASARTAEERKSEWPERPGMALAATSAAGNGHADAPLPNELPHAGPVELGKNSDRNAARRIREEFFRAVQDMSWALDGRQVSGDREAIVAIAEGARSLVSRKATLLRFVALNVAWANRRKRDFSQRFRSLWQGAISSRRREDGRAELTKLRKRAVARRELRLARDEEGRYLATFDFMAAELADTSERKRIGDHIVAFAQGASWVVAGGKYCRIDIAVVDATTRRFIPGLTIRATLIDTYGHDVADFEVPIVWHPGFPHYGIHVKVPRAGPHDLRVRIEPSTLPGNAPASTSSLELTFNGVPINIGEQ